jgi:hypothetical protein
MAKLTQPELLGIFNALKAEMKPYEAGNMVAVFDMEGKYDLWTNKPVVVAGRPRERINFAGIIVQSNYVGFYYMPVYCNPDKVAPLLSPEFMKLLKGKACFHIKKTDEQVIADVRTAMRIGFDQYEKNGWL